MNWGKCFGIAMACAWALGCGSSGPQPTVDRTGYTPLCPAEHVALDFLTDISDWGTVTSIPQVREALKEMKKTHPNEADALEKKVTELSTAGSPDEIKAKAKAIVDGIVRGQQAPKQ